MTWATTSRSSRSPASSAAAPRSPPESFVPARSSSSSAVSTCRGGGANFIKALLK